MKKLYTIIILLLPYFVFAQQQPKASNFKETNFAWNPAMTGLWDFWEISVSYRQQWVGFADAPKTAFMGFQMPIPGNNMSIGGSILHDKTNPLSFNGITFSYAYRIKTGLFYKDQLSIGLLANLSEYRLSYQDAMVNDLDDNLLLGDASSSILPNAGVGIYYSSHAGNEFERSYFFFGAAAQRLFQTDLTFSNGSDSNLKRAIHANALAGFRFINGDVALEPSAWVDYAHTGIANATLSLKMEKFESFWTGFSFSTDKTFGLQAGVVIKKKFLRDGSLRIGTLGAYNLSGFGQYNALGYEFYVAYRFRD